jgi:hypothetical protein
MKTTHKCSRWREVIRLWAWGDLAREEAAQVEAHINTCGECRRYAEEVQAAAAGLRWLGSREVEPSAGFRTRWTRAVEEAAQPKGFGESAAALGAWWRDLLLRNRRPALGMASLWILALLFRLSAPEAAPPARTTTARSPAEIVRALEADQRLLAWHFWKKGPLSVPEQKPQSPQPRSEWLRKWPAAQSDHGPDAHVAVKMVYLNLIARGGISAPPTV